MNKKIQFDIAYSMFENENITKDEMSKKLYKNIEEINQNYDYLVKNGYIENDKITKKTLDYFENHKVENAIILAAGMSTRFVPLCWEKPKGLLEVNGEVLIERQIRQLREKGIDEIVIVVGYMKEQFQYLKDKYNVILIETDEYRIRNNHSSVFAAKDFLKNSIVTNSDLYFKENLFQKYAYDSYYLSPFINDKTDERGVITDSDDKIIKTIYDKNLNNTWVTLGYAYFTKSFSDKLIKYIDEIYYLEETMRKYWADIQDEHLNELYMYVKKVPLELVLEFDYFEDLRKFDLEYQKDSHSKILKKVSNQLGVNESQINTLKYIDIDTFSFYCDGKKYISNKNGDIISDEINRLYEISKNFLDYHKDTLPLCAAENVISKFADIPLSLGLQERYIMNNTYSYRNEDNFIGSEVLLPIYQELSNVCERLFNAKYTDARTFSGMNCIDMIVKIICKPGDKIGILSKEYGGHASVKPVLERDGIEVVELPYKLEDKDIDWEATNRIVAEENIKAILLADSDLIKPLSVKKFDTSKCILLYDCSQTMGFIASGMEYNPLGDKKNVILFGGTHKTIPGPTSGLIMTNDEDLHELLEVNINPKYLRNPQMHQKTSLLFTLIEFEKFGRDYMEKVLHDSNYIAKRIDEKGILNVDRVSENEYSRTHQIFIRTTKEMMERIYTNAIKYKITLNKKSKALFQNYGIRLGTQEIARYNWSDETLDIIAEIFCKLAEENIDEEEMLFLMKKLPEKKVNFTFDDEVIRRFDELKK